MLNKNDYLIELSSGPNTEFGNIGFAVQAEPQKVFSAIWELEGQVNNGGFSQFFINVEVGLIHFTPEALRRIGACPCARIVQEALDCAGFLPEDKAERARKLGQWDSAVMEKLDALDTEFFAYPSDLTELLFAFVEKHPEEFGPIPCM